MGIVRIHFTQWKLLSLKNKTQNKQTNERKKKSSIFYEEVLHKDPANGADDGAVARYAFVPLLRS
jgi:hypothetical protein